jgi:hypothetical protein
MDNSENYIENIKEIIINSIELYDRKYIKYREIMKSRSEIIKDINKIRFYSKEDELLLEVNYQYAGYYDMNNNIWIWAWLLPLTNNNTKLSRDLLQYGLKLDVNSINNDQIFIKNLLLNSRFVIKDKIGLDINLAIFSFILKEKILFIYPHVINNDITIYYFITD